MTINNSSELYRTVKAISKDATRYSMCRLHVETDWIVATDGRRMHVMRNLFDIPEGEYTVEKSTKTKTVLDKMDNPDGVFPNWRRVVPTSFDSVIGLDMSADKIDVALDEIAQRCMINHKYLLDIQSDERYTVGFPEPKKDANGEVKITESVTFAQRNFFAVIMPIMRPYHWDTNASEDENLELHAITAQATAKEVTA